MHWIVRVLMEQMAQRVPPAQQVQQELRVQMVQLEQQVQREPLALPARRGRKGQPGRQVQLGLRSDDVVHSLWVPELGGKRDLVPGRVNQLVVTATRPGRYRGQCAEFCGEQHARMALHVLVMPADKFDAWLARQREPAPSPSPASPAGCSATRRTRRT